MTDHPFDLDDDTLVEQPSEDKQCPACSAKGTIWVYRRLRKCENCGLGWKEGGIPGPNQIHINDKPDVVDSDQLSLGDGFESIGALRRFLSSVKEETADDTADATDDTSGSSDAAETTVYTPNSDENGDTTVYTDESMDRCPECQMNLGGYGDANFCPSCGMDLS